MQKSIDDFKGYDYMELVEFLLNKTIEDYRKDFFCHDQDEDFLEKFMIEDTHEKISAMMEDTDFYKSDIMATRDFVQAVANQEYKHGTRYPLINGLLMIQDDWTFLKYVDILLEHLWT